jgi:hypothetical protein
MMRMRTATMYDFPVNLQKFASINATEHHSGVSNKYAFIPTTTALATLEKSGWVPVAAKESAVRGEDGAGYQKHLIVLRNQSFELDLKLGQRKPQILLTNSHDGASSFALRMGIFELICKNGLVVSRGEMSTVRVRHIGYGAAQMETAVERLMAQYPAAIDVIGQWNDIRLTGDEQRAMASAAIDLRWDGEAYAVDPNALLRVRHSQQAAPTLWNTFNVIQENLIRGGVPARNVKPGSKSYGKEQRSRAVGSIGEDIRLNKALWTLAEKMAELKG